MGNVKQKCTKKTKTESNTETKPASKPTSSPKKKGRPSRKPAYRPSPARAGATLHDSIGRAVIKESDRIAEAIVNQTIGGSSASAKILTDVTGAKNPVQAKPPQKRQGRSLLDLLALDQEWSDPLEEEEPTPLPQEQLS